MKPSILLLLLLLSQVAVAQRFSIKGRVADEKNSALPSATVLLLQAKDSALVSFGATDAQGAFELKQVTKGDHLLKITFMGYSPYFEKIVPPAAGAALDLGSIQLQPKSNELQEVLVQGEKSPIEIKKDTIEYNAGSFKTQPNAAVQDLLKKLPGVQVETDGSIMVQGQKVQRVTVDGKEFFGKDPAIATQNLPADAVDKVQVFDKKSDQAMFSGIDDGQKEKTINLQLKEEKRNSAFGNVMAGIGTDERYQAKASVNRFNKGKQLSFLGMANNVNSQGFGLSDYMTFTGGMQQTMGGSGRRTITLNSNNSSGIPLNFGGRMNGFMDTYAGGLNFSNQLTKKTEANGSYFLNHLGQDINRQLVRENFLSAGTFTFSQDGRQQTANTGHRANLTLDHKIDSLNSLTFKATMGYTQSNLEEQSQSQTLSPENTVENEGTRSSYSSGNGFNLNSSLLFRHRFGKPGRTLSANTEFSASGNGSDGWLEASNRYGSGELETINQENEQDNGSQSYGLSLSYTEPLGNRQYLEANYNYRQDVNEVDREVFDLTDNVRELNTALSNKYNSNYHYHRSGLNYRLNRRNYNLVVGSSVQQSKLAGELLLLDSDINRTFQNVLPSARLNYDFSGNTRLGLNYETSVQEPTIQQLQPVVDNTDPLNLYVGNPNLRPAYVHTWNLNFNTFDPGRFINLFAMVNVVHMTNAITNAQRFNERLVRTTTPVNVDDNTSINAFANVGFPVKRFNSRLSLSTNLRQQYSTNILNDVANDIAIRNIGGNFRYEYRLKEIFDLALRAELSQQKTEYAFNQEQNQRFFNKTYAAETNLHFLKGFHFNSSFEYMVYRNARAGFEQEIPLLNFALSRQFLKNKAGELKLSAQNVLNEALGVTQTANVNYVERETINSLGRYFMLSFTYNINKHLNPMNSRPGGAIRIMR